MLLIGCNLIGDNVVPFAATRTPLPAAATITASPGPTATEVSEWERLVPGLEMLTTEMPAPGVGSTTAVLVRIDPQQFIFRVHYAPYQATSIAGWLSRIDAPVIVNGGFFLGNNLTNGLLIVDGQRFGTTFDRHGGMLTLVGDQINVRSLAQAPYSKSETLDQAVQGRPMLLYPGGFPVVMGDIEHEAGRRTAVALDMRGRLVLIVIDEGAVTLERLRDWLANERPDLELSVAFNLDGGTSTGLSIKTEKHSLLLDSHGALPEIIAFYPKP